MDGQQAFNQLQSDVDGWVESLADWDNLPAGKVPKSDDTKVLRDAVTGYQELKPYEYLVLDSPLLQRLRYIHQTGLAYLVYPSANHTRFEHSLDCAKIAQRLGESIMPGENTRIAEVRLAALLHDVGHTFFSHLAESIMESHFRELYFALKEAPVFAGHDLRLGEIMSYLIVKSHPFNAFLQRVLACYGGTLDLDNVTKLVMHGARDEFAFMGDIISGPFDVDKLDYLVRDCYFCGIRADVDVERVVVSAARLDPFRFPADDPAWKRRHMVMRSGGVSILEQITFNKMLLYTAIYHHHKVRAIECMVKSIFEALWEDPAMVGSPSFRFERLIDFYQFTDNTFLTAAHSEEGLRTYIQRLLNRDLLKRCLVISRPYLKKEKREAFYDPIRISYEDNPEELRELREAILHELPTDKRGSVHDLWLDLPKRPDLGSDADRAYIDIGSREMPRLAEFFPYPQWVSSYELNKWKGHVFCVNDPDVRWAVNKAAQEVFRSLYEMEFEERATVECKLD